MGPWRKGSVSSAAIDQLHELSASRFGTTQNIYGPLEIVKLGKWRIRVLHPNFLHEGRAAKVGELLTVDSDLAADLCKRGLAEPSP